MSDQIVQYNIAIIAALSVLIGAVIGACASLLSSFVSRKVTELGRVDVFCRIVHSKTGRKSFGVYNSSITNKHVLIIPMWMEMANTAMSAKYIRDFNVVAYNNNEMVAEFVQIQGINIGEENELEFGNHQSYSFMVDGKTIQRFELEFMLHESSLQDENKAFNVLKVRYYDERGNRTENTIYSNSSPIEWKIGDIPYKKEWILVSGRKR